MTARRVVRSATEADIVDASSRTPAGTLHSGRRHAQLWAELRQTGAIIGSHDLWLAATCVAHGLTMVTASLREFERVPGLQCEVWSQVS